MFGWFLGAALAADVQTVEEVDLERYLGTWYEIASFPAWFQRGCTATTATYVPHPRRDELIRVENRCRDGSLDGDLRTAVGRAKVVDPETNAKLKVSFFGPFWGDYWILGLDPEYQWALVGSPDRDYLWVLSRDPRLDEATYASIVEKAEQQGYDVGRLVRTAQPADAPVMPAPQPAIAD
jgi:apolipoprotein D and lipocalin family protein